MSLFQLLSEVINESKFFCNVIVPVDSILDFLANLPVEAFFLLTIPIRFFVCLLLEIFNVNPYCILYNLAFPVSMLCPLVNMNSQLACSTYNNSCCLQSNCKSIVVPFIQSLCQNCQPSVLNYIFCVIGYVIEVALTPLIFLINPIIASIIGEPICWNPQFNCKQPYLG